MMMADFWAWIADSKVVEPDGRATLVFHGSADPRGLVGLPPMSHFGTAAAARDRLLQFSGCLPQGWDDDYRAAIASPEFFPHLDALRFEGGRGEAFHIYPDGAFLLPAYLRIVRPAPIYDDGQPHTPQTVAAHLGRSWRFYEEVEAATGMEEEEIDVAINRLSRARTWKPLVDLLGRLGYDGFSYNNVVEDRGSKSWVIFAPEQIWPVFGDGPLPAVHPGRTASKGPRR